MMLFGKEYNRILIVEPHADDIWLNMGGTILKYLNDPSVILMTVVRPYNLNPESSQGLLQELNIKNFQQLDYADIPFRLVEHRNLTKILGDDYTAEAAFRYYNNDSNFGCAIENVKSIDPDLIILPLGVQHMMHIYIREKLSNFNKEILYYKDIPYAYKKKNQKYLEQLMQIVEPAGEVSLTEEEIQEKLRIFKKVYPSQWYFIRDIKDHPVERFYRLRRN